MDHIATKNKTFSNQCYKDYEIGISIYDGCVFEQCVFKNFVFRGCTFFDCKFINCVFEFMQFYQCFVKNCTVTNCTVRRCSCLYSSFTNTDFPMACPRTGGFTAFKKVISYNSKKTLIAELYVPEDAARSSALSNKCRCDKAIVVRFYDPNTLQPVKNKAARSWFKPSFIYRINDIVRPINYFDTDRYRECAAGIHFFMTIEEAKNY